MTTIAREMIEAAATAIANNRAARGSNAPAISNVLAILPQKLKEQVLEDAEDALKAASEVASASLAPVAIPAAGSEDRHFWLEAAEHHGVGQMSKGHYAGTEDAILKLMAAAREQGRRDALNALATSGAR